jgi:hypothetical protein
MSKLLNTFHIGALGILVWSCTASAQSLVRVASATDGNGLFSYTFAPVSSSYIWGVSPGNGIVLQSHAVLETISPPGWVASVDADELVSWTAASGTVFMDVPLTFSVRSAFTGVALYDQLLGSGDIYQGGIVGGMAYDLADYSEITVGLERFSFFGPQVIPEPSCLAVAALGGLLVAVARRVRTRLAF